MNYRREKIDNTETNRNFFDKTNKIEETLARLIKKKRCKLPIQPILM